MKDQKITIYSKSGFGNVVRTEAKLIELGRMDYAQYRHCHFVTFVPKGKRNPRRLIATYAPYLFILPGWNRPDMPDPFSPVSEQTLSNGAVIEVRKLASFDPAFVTAADAILDPLADQALLDVRDGREYNYEQRVRMLENQGLCTSEFGLAARPTRLSTVDVNTATPKLQQSDDLVPDMK